MKKRILIVEDELAYVTLLQSELEAKGYEVQTANDGEKGLKMALQSHPDLILLDIKMPVMDGIEMLSELRKDEYGAQAKVILLTNLEPDPEIIKQAIKDQPSYYLIKSDIKMEELYAMLEKLMTKEGDAEEDSNESAPTIPEEVAA